MNCINLVARCIQFIEFVYFCQINSRRCLEDLEWNGWGWKVESSVIAGPNLVYTLWISGRRLAVIHLDK